MSVVINDFDLVPDSAPAGAAADTQPPEPGEPPMPRVTDIEEIMRYLRERLMRVLAD